MVSEDILTQKLGLLPDTGAAKNGGHPKWVESNWVMCQSSSFGMLWLMRRFDHGVLRIGAGLCTLLALLLWWLLWKLEYMFIVYLQASISWMMSALVLLLLLVFCVATHFFH